MVGLTTLLVGVALLVAQIVVIEQLRRQRKETERVHGLYRALAKDVAELRGDVPSLREHVLREAGHEVFHVDTKSARVTGSKADLIQAFGSRYSVESYDDELDEALKQCAVEE